MLKIDDQLQACLHLLHLHPNICLRFVQAHQIRKSTSLQQATQLCKGSFTILSISYPPCPPEDRLQLCRLPQGLQGPDLRTCRTRLSVPLPNWLPRPSLLTRPNSRMLKKTANRLFFALLVLPTHRRRCPQGCLRAPAVSLPRPSIQDLVDLPGLRLNPSDLHHGRHMELRLLQLCPHDQHALHHRWPTRKMSLWLVRH